NPLNAQLLFNTHDTHLLNEVLLNDKMMTFSQSRRVACNRVSYQTDIFLKLCLKQIFDSLSQKS
ncbi:MAG: hypothetical protein RL329_2850, partial [Bacteroidota bacterium]